MRKTVWSVLLLLAFLALASSAHAQTLSATVVWTHADTIADVNLYAFTIQEDGGSVVALPATCVDGSPVACKAALPVEMVKTLIPRSTHSFVITATTSGGSASGSLDYTKPDPNPAKPDAITISVTFTVP